MVGREEPLSRLAELIGRAPAGGGAILLTGEVGVGKSALVEAGAAIARTAGFRVLNCSGVEGETQIGLAGLHELLRVIMDRAEILPEHHRAVLFSVFGLGPRIAMDRLQLSEAVLGLLTALAAEQPLMMVLDDAHWMDQPTLSMIAFLVQRVADAPIVMVVARRPQGAEALTGLGLDEITLERLGDADARALVARRHPDLPNHLRRQVLDEAGGNPLALIELAREAADGRRDTSGSPLRARLERGYAAQAAALSEKAQDLLLLVAAANDGSLAELAPAAGRLGLDLGALADAEKAGLIGTTGTTVTFRHPLIRSAIYESGGLHRRVRTHQALAATLADLGQPSQAAWHRAAATFGFDDEVARDLEEAAAGDALRGLHGGAMRALERAAALTRDRDERGRRLVLAVQEARLAGMAAEARRLAARAAEATADPVIRGHLSMALTSLDLHSDVRVCDPAELLDQALRTAAAGYPDMSVYLLGCAAFVERHRPATAELRQRIIAALDACGLPDADPRVLIARVLLAPAAKPWVQDHAKDPSTLPPDLAAGLGAAAEALQDWPLAERFSVFAIASYQSRGKHADAVAVRAELALTLLVQGRLAEARAEAEAVLPIAAAGDLPVAVVLAGAVLDHVHAWNGGPVTTAAPIRPDVDALRPWAAGLSALGRGDHAAAYDALSAAAGHPDVAMPSIADLAEAAVGCGRGDAVRAAVEEAGRLAEATGSALLRALVHRAHALLGDDPEENYRRAMAHDFPLQEARTNVLYGEWLHRQSRNAEARAALATAATAFAEAGAGPWLTRAERTLRTV